MDWNVFPVYISGIHSRMWSYLCLRLMLILVADGCIGWAGGVWGCMERGGAELKPTFKHKKRRKKSQGARRHSLNAVRKSVPSKNQKKNKT